MHLHPRDNNNEDIKVSGGGGEVGRTEKIAMNLNSYNFPLVGHILSYVISRSLCQDMWKGQVLHKICNYDFQVHFY